MQALLENIELDVQELKCLVQTMSDGKYNPALKIVAKRNIQQLRKRLDTLQEWLEESSVESPAVQINPELVETLNNPVTKKDEMSTIGREELSEEIERGSDNSVTQQAPGLNGVGVKSSAVLGDCIKSATDLKHSISLNDSFRFTREIFGGDAARMSKVVYQLGEAPSFDEALEIFHSMVEPDEDNEVINEFIEILRKYFN